MKVKRIIHGIFLVLALSVLGLLFYYAVWLLTDEDFRDMMFKYGWPWNSWIVLIDYVACCLFSTVVTLYYWRSREKTERERDKFRLQALENQLSPHFVFNNFSILADLIEVSPERASEFLINLSKIYRYTLSHLDHDTVTLQEELEFLDRYMALLHQRIGKGILIRIAPELSTLQGKLPPAALQILIENAIKHNEHTQAHPLVIRVSSNGDSICVSNNKQPITSESSTNVGQHNIVERYRLLTSRKIKINNTPNDYCVTIPLLTDK